MFTNFHRYMEREAKEVIEVTEEEFIAAFVAEGMTEEKAKFQAAISKGLGASTEVGSRMLKIKTEP